MLSWQPRPDQTISTCSESVWIKPSECIKQQRKQANVVTEMKIRPTIVWEEQALSMESSIEKKAEQRKTGVHWGWDQLLVSRGSSLHPWQNKQGDVKRKYTKYPPKQTINGWLTPKPLKLETKALATFARNPYSVKKKRMLVPLYLPL